MSTAIHICWNLIDSPFFRGNNLHDACLHSIFIDFVDEALEVSELVHCLKQYHSQPGSKGCVLYCPA